MQMTATPVARTAARVVGSAAALALVLAACSTQSDAAPPAEDEGPGVHVVATTTVLGDVVGRVVTCAGGSVDTLIPIGADPHDYSPSSAAVRSLVEADLVVANGLGLEEGLESALASAEQDGALVFEVAPLLDPIPFGGSDHSDADGDHADEGDAHADDDGDHADEGDAHADADDGHGHDGSDDPHVWLDVTRMADAAALVGAELAAITGDAAFEECGSSAEEELRAVDVEVREILAAVPDEARVLVTDHDAFGYFAAAYDFDVVGVVIPGGSTLADTSSASLAALADTIRTTGVPAIFGNLAAPNALVDALAGEVGDVTVVPLHVGSLGPDGSDAGDYPSMMLTNARLIAGALAG